MRRHVLIVEDHEDAREAVRCLLEVRGHRVDVAGDGAEGLATALRSRPDAVLIDIGIPGLDGYEVARRLRSCPEGEGMFLVAVTGYGQADDRRQALENGFDAHLVKPVEPEDLYRLLDSS